jgi:uncharacterized repeat protein (TIGR03803 family)
MHRRTPFVRLLVTITFSLFVVIPNSAWGQWTETVLHTFPLGADGTFPASNFVFDSSGNLYGTTVAGGTTNLGTVFELSPKSGGGWTENIIYSFGGNDGDGPEAGLIRDSAGNLYGTTIVGGSHDQGVVFELSLVSGGWQETVLYSFTGGTDGGIPVSSLILDPTGNLYGTTTAGGAVSACFGSGCGTVFKLTPGSAGWSESVVYSFLGMPDGSNPRTSVMLDSAGNLYGTTYQGGADGWGTVFELSPGSGGYWNENILHNFSLQNNDGISPLSPVILGPAGKLYGTTSQGDSHRGGVVYELAQASGSWQERIVYAFTGKSDGDEPEAGLIYHGGSLYGTCAGGGGLEGGGVVFKLTKGLDNIWQETVLHSFGSGSTGYFLLAPLTSDAAGNLYSTAQFGGVSGFGTAFKLTVDSGYAETVMHSFSGEPDGAEPEAGLAFGLHGNLYGTAFAGGAHNYGTVFQLTPHSGVWSAKVLHSFRSGKDGANPGSQVIVDAAGNLYGTTPFGGTPGKCQTVGCGIVYELTNSGSGWVETVLHTFGENPGDGISPYANLVFDSAGNLYGTTYQGGSFGNGTAFELSHGSSGWTETILYNFTGGSDGSFPLANVIFDAVGNLYGTTQSGGAFGRGAVFRLAPSLGGWSESVLYSFAGGSDGFQPNGGLVFDALGKLYGTTMEGGVGAGCSDGCGTVFELTPSSGGGWLKSTLFNFAGTDTGIFPSASLVVDSAGNLYGLANLAFELSPAAGGTWTETILNSFISVSGGSNPEGNVIFNKAGKLYGTTNGGGSAGLGVVFELVP